MGPRPVQETYAEVVDGALLREQRIAAGLTYRGLAQKIGAKSWSSLRRLEIPIERGGRHTLSVERAVRISIAAQIPPHTLHHYFRFHGVEAGAA